MFNHTSASSHRSIIILISLFSCDTNWPLSNHLLFLEISRDKIIWTWLDDCHLSLSSITSQQFPIDLLQGHYIAACVYYFITTIIQCISTISDMYKDNLLCTHWFNNQFKCPWFYCFLFRFNIVRDLFW